MIKNYIKIALRNLWRHKGFSLINIIGLAVGMAAAILILLWIQSEISYDEFHKNKDRIYRVWNRVPKDGEIKVWNSVSAPTAPA
ncbi:MAG: ABC transporter permease, partial [Mucilaginibacter sp.]